MSVHSYSYRENAPNTRSPTHFEHLPLCHFPSGKCLMPVKSQSLFCPHLVRHQLSRQLNEDCGFTQTIAGRYCGGDSSWDPVLNLTRHSSGWLCCQKRFDHQSWMAFKGLMSSASEYCSPVFPPGYLVTFMCWYIFKCWLFSWFSSPQDRAQNKKGGYLWMNNQYLNRQQLNTNFQSQWNMGLHWSILKHSHIH